MLVNWGGKHQSNVGTTRSVSTKLCVTNSTWDQVCKNNLYEDIGRNVAKGQLISSRLIKMLMRMVRQIEEFRIH